MSRFSYLMAGFQVSTYGRFWVSPEAERLGHPVRVSNHAIASSAPANT
jgi:hypothetical protein